jgi:hypothetical protein
MPHDRLTTKPSPQPPRLWAELPETTRRRLACLVAQMLHAQLPADPIEGHLDVVEAGRL